MKEEILDIEYVGAVLEVALQDLDFDFKPFLKENEQILWVGKPQKKGYYSRWEISILVICGLLVLIALPLLLFGIPLVLVAWFMYYHWISLPAKYLSQSFYCITTQHCIITNRYGEPSMKQMKIADLSALKREKTIKGHGTIFMNGKIYRSRVGPSIAPTSAWSLQFEHVPHVEVVYHLLKNHEEYGTTKESNQE